MNEWGCSRSATFVHTESTGPEEPIEYAAMNQMTQLNSRRKIRNSSPDDLTPSVLPLVHVGSPQYAIVMSGQGRNV